MRSSCVLRQLTLQGISLEDPSLIVCLEGLPYLSELELQEFDNAIPTVRWHLFDHMTYDGLSMLVLKLEVLKLDLNFAPGGDILPRMIQSRLDLMEGIEASTAVQNMVRLKFVHLNLCHKAGCKKLAMTRCWLNKGVDIQIMAEGKRWL
jgi:hypothetical protein